MAAEGELLPGTHLYLASPANPRIKEVVKLRQRSHRDELRLMVIEGYRELKRALGAGYRPQHLFYCRELFLKDENEAALIAAAQQAGAELLECSAAAFRKMAYRDRPDGLLAVGPYLDGTLAGLRLPSRALVVVAEGIEKPGNLGTILRSADGAGAAAVIVCDGCTDIHNPNVVRASTGTLFALPVVEATGAEVRDFLKARNFAVVATTPHATQPYSALDLTGNVAIVLGSEQYGLTPPWLECATHQVTIPMCGVADSLNVSAAATILLFEAQRQRLRHGESLTTEAQRSWRGVAAAKTLSQALS